MSGEQMDPANWQFLDALVHSRRDAPDDLYPRLIQSAFRGEIAWEYIAASKFAVQGLNKLFVDMATSLDTCDQLAGLLKSMHGASQQSWGPHSGRLRATTGRAGMILLARARGDRKSRPLPAGWEAVCQDAVDQAAADLLSGKAKGASSAAYWANHMLAAGRQRPGLDLAG